MNIPTLPSLPSDNLYKFMTVLGVALTVAGIVLPFTMARQSRQDDLDQRKIELDQIEKLSKDQDDFRKTMDDMLRLPPPPEMTPEIVKKYYDVRLNSLEAQKDYSKLRHMQLKAITLVRPDLEFKDLKKGVYVVWTGGVITALGFGLWWWRFQRFQDQIVRAEADKIKEAKKPSRLIVG